MRGFKLAFITFMARSSIAGKSVWRLLSPDRFVFISNLWDKDKELKIK